MSDKKWALVTGANGGLGRVISTKLATDHGFKVLAAARTLTEAEEVANTIRQAGASAFPIALDVGSDAGTAGLADAVAKHTDKLDVLVNCAGINPMMDPNEADFLTMSTQTASKAFDINALGALRVIQALAPALQNSGAGRVVNVSTEMAALATLADDFYPLAPSYRLSKVAMNGITVLAARELAASHIKVNAYSPGWMRTAMGGEDAPFSAEEGAETALWLATLDENGPTGGFFAEMRRLGGAIPLQW